MRAVCSRLAPLWPRMKDALVSRNVVGRSTAVSRAMTLWPWAVCVRAALGSAIVPATGEEISPVTSWLLRAPVTASRFLSLSVRSSFSTPVHPLVPGPMLKSSVPPGVARPLFTKVGILDWSMLTPRVSSSTSKEPRT